MPDSNSSEPSLSPFWLASNHAVPVILYLPDGLTGSAPLPV